MSLVNTDRIRPHGCRHGAMLALGLGLIMLASRAVATAATEAPGDRHGFGTTDSQPPWGELETIEFSLDLSDEQLLQIQPLLGDPKWFFPGYSLQATTNLLRSCQFTEADLGRVMSNLEFEAVIPGQPAHDNTGIALTDLLLTGVRVFPPPDLVLNLGASARQRIYSILSTSPENTDHRVPFRLVPEDFESLLAGTRLPANKSGMIRQLVYTNDAMVCLADLPSLRHILTSDELKSLLKMLYHAPTFVLQVKFPPGMDVDRMARYWGHGGREGVIRPFLQGLSKVPGEPAVSVSFMFPAFARTRLYTFPDPARDPANLPRQGLWTALNFFNERPDTRYLDDEYARRTLKTDFRVTRRAPAYGDLIVLTAPSGDLVHASVYIADGVVFTRSGADPVQPWVLMKLPDVMARFGAVEPLQPLVYRRKQA